MAAETLFIATTPGLEQVLLAEARGLGEAHVVRGGVRLTGSARVHRLANLTLRCASRVLASKPPSGGSTPRASFFTGAATGRRSRGRRCARRWPAGVRLADHRPTEPLWDPLCGSGTIAIEAALVSRGIAAGLHRSFAFEQFPSHDPVAYEREKAALRSSQLPDVPAPIWASDLNAGSLGTARRNAARAGVGADLKLFRHDATEPVSDLPPGALVISGICRTARGRGRDPTCRDSIEHVVEACRLSGAARAGFLTADPRAPGWLGLKGSKSFPVDNGGLKCLFVVGEL